MAHNMPRPGGQLPQPMASLCMGLHQSAEGEIQQINILQQEGVTYDYWWMDAGWYPCEEWWDGVGTWTPDPKRFPRGIKEVSDYAHANGMKLILWFEPERVYSGTWLYEHHPEWLLSLPPGAPQRTWAPDSRLLNLGNPAARQWLTDHVDRFIREQGVDLYRQDFNFDPLPYWRGNDAPDRQGMTENLHVQGYLAYWDELRRRHPGMLIDSCAAGGGRNDLETLRRAVPLLRSDFQGPGGPNRATGNQGHTYGLAMWIPYYGTGEYYNDGYSFRSHMCPAMGVGYDPGQSAVDWAALRRAIEEWRAVAPLYSGDYYPLTVYDLDETVWMAWQFNRPDLGEGVVQAFRRTESVYESARFKLHGLDPESRYKLQDFDKKETTDVSGRELMEAGLLVRLPHPRSSALIHYKREI